MKKNDCSLDVFDHIRNVQEALLFFAVHLMERGINHDDSKLHPPEKELFDEYAQKLKDIVYGSDQYKQNLKELGVALTHHYAKNRHHPEHFRNGINGMTLIDLVEMFCDWRAVTKVIKEGDLLKSIEKNAIRFEIGDQLEEVLINTCISLEW